MVRSGNQGEKLLEAYFTPTGFIIEEYLFELEPEAEELERPDFHNSKEAWAARFREDKYSALFHLGFLEKPGWVSPALGYLHHIAELLIGKISRQAALEIHREGVQTDLPAEEIKRLIGEVPFALGMENVNADWLKRLWVKLLTVFQEEIRDYEGTVKRYFAEHHSPLNLAGRVFFHLVENEGDEEFPFAFMATYSTRAVKSKKAVHTPLKNALAEFKGEEKKLLNLISTVIRAAAKSEFISGLLESGELFAPLKLTAAEAYRVLREIPLYEETGIMCRIPDWWRKDRKSVRLSLTVGNREPSRVGLEAIMDFSPLIKVGETPLTEEEVKEFLNMAEGLVRYKGRWVEISKSKLETLLQVLEKVEGFAEDGALTLGEAMRLELNGNELLDIPAEEMEITVTNGEWLENLRGRLTQPEILPEVAPAPTLRAILRPYQKDGYRWLSQMAALKFGACLADDMGLGKTVQMIACLEQARIDHGGKALLILPASLIGNWEKEIEKFAPEMPYQILHRSGLKAGQVLTINEKNFLFITTYGMAARLEMLKNRDWDYLILDEAQAIKNPGTKQRKAIKEIRAGMRVALTGTPIENRLGDLWSLFDLLNQGLLGTAKEFAEFTKGLSEYSGGYSRLRKMIAPFILRRLKTDRSIIADLPEKLETDYYYITLTQKQVLLYRQLLCRLEEKLAEAEGIERKGLILASIMKCKQICNHPDQFIGREEYKPSQSGKFTQLKEICETIREKRERVLVFTQFREMTAPLANLLATVFGKKGFVFHGGTPVKKRSEMVTRFNGEEYIPYMVISLKAGGVGLNLTAANHVIHFDRWWNPAVENQATDRAFRIGQKKNVVVHKFITKGTIEEKIGEILEEKKKLTGDVLGAGEQWLTEYSNEELLALFSLESDSA